MSEIIHRGTLTKDKLKELVNTHLEITCESDKYDPEVNQGVISLIKQSDGNWKGYMTKNSKLLEVREINPEYCLQKLLTHE